jgi:hypothetical protein
MERPWQDKYSIFLQELVEKLHGKVIEVPRREPKDDTAWGGSHVLLYPKFEFQKDSLQILIDLEEGPHLRRQLFEDLDNVEYLRIAVYKKHVYTLVLNKEGFADKFLKALRLNWEFQTGSKDFDSKFNISLKSEEDKRFIKEGYTQQLIQNLTPFDELAVYKTGIFWSREVYDSSQLTYDYLEPFLRYSIELANIV